MSHRVFHREILDQKKKNQENAHVVLSFLAFWYLKHTHIKKKINSHLNIDLLDILFSTLTKNRGTLRGFFFF